MIKMLDEKDRIFNNLYGQESSDLNSSKNRGDWSNTCLLYTSDAADE